MPDKDRPIHMVMRYADSLLSVDSTVAEHQAIIEQHGSVWIGKLGRPVARRHIEKLKHQCADEIATYLFLVQKVGPSYQVHRGRMLTAAPQLPRGEHALVPSYYAERRILRKVRFWAKLSEIAPVKQSALNELRIASSGIALPETLKLSMAPAFIVEEGRGRSF